MACSSPVRVVELGVRGEAAGQRAAEVARADGVQLVGQLIGQRAGLDGGERAPGVGDDVGVGGEVHVLVHRAARPLLAERCSATALERTQRLRYHSALPSRSRTPCTMPAPRNQW